MSIASSSFPNFIDKTYIFVCFIDNAYIIVYNMPSNI